MAINKKKSLENYIKARLGAPVADLCSSEVDAFKVACETASSEYWTAVPYVKTKSYSVSGACNTELTVSLDALKTEFFPDATIRDNADFIGIVRYDYSDIYTRYPGNYNYFDYHLLGGKVNGHYNSNYPQQDPRYIADRIQHANTTEDMLFGELDYRHDILDNTIKFIFPDAQGSAVVWFGWGFCPSMTVDLIPANHFNTFRKMVAYYFVDTVIAARSALTLDTDYTLSTDYLEKRADELKEEFQKGLADIATVPMVWG